MTASEPEDESRACCTLPESGGRTAPAGHGDTRTVQGLTHRGSALPRTLPVSGAHRDGRRWGRPSGSTSRVATGIRSSAAQLDSRDSAWLWYLRGLGFAIHCMPPQLSHGSIFAMESGAPPLGTISRSRIASSSDVVRPNSGYPSIIWTGDREHHYALLGGFPHFQDFTAVHSDPRDWSAGWHTRRPSLSISPEMESLHVYVEPRWGVESRELDTYRCRRHVGIHRRSPRLCAHVIALRLAANHANAVPIFSAGNPRERARVFPGVSIVSVDDLGFRISVSAGRTILHGHDRVWARHGPVRGFRLSPSSRQGSVACPRRGLAFFPLV